VVSGELSGDGITNVRKIYEQWTRYGYPCIWSVYKGRGIEWYAAETGPIFDWMSRKVRVNGTATLALGNGIGSRKPWVMLRDTDTRFYWLQADRIMPGKAAGAIPAEIQGDIRGNNQIVLNTNRVKQLTVWLSSDMIDWTKPVRLQINGSTPQGWAKPKMFEPNIEVLLQDYHERGDRRMLFMNKIEISTIP
jgi:hypothetical protein